MSDAPGRRYRYRGLEFWAERGMIRMEDQITGEFFTLTRKEALERAKAINDEIPMVKFGDEREEMNSLVQNVIDVVKTAKTQGDPMDPEVSLGKAREIKRSGSASKLILPSGTIPNIRNKEVDSLFDEYKAKRCR